MYAFCSLFLGCIAIVGADRCITSFLTRLWLLKVLAIIATILVLAGLLAGHVVGYRCDGSRWVLLAFFRDIDVADPGKFRGWLVLISLEASV